MRVGIDPGHGGSNAGATSNGIKEEELNLQMALILRPILSGMGFEFVLTRHTDESVSFERRGHLCRSCDLIMVLHADVNPVPTVGTLSTYVIPTDTVGLLMAGEIERCAPAPIRPKNSTPQFASADNWTRRAYTCIAPHAPRPCVLVEMVFISKPEHVRFIKSEPARLWLATSLAQGIAVGAYTLTNSPQLKSQALV